MANINILANWYEMQGLTRGKIEFVFTIFKLASIFGVTSIPFWFTFDRINFDVSNITFGLRWTWIWIYYLLTYGVMSSVIIKTLYKNIQDILDNSEMFSGLDINTTEGVTIEKLVTYANTTKEDFLLRANKMDNILMACEEKLYFQTSFFSSMLGTIPLELATKFLIQTYFFGFNNKILTREGFYQNADIEIGSQFKNIDQNSRDFKAFCKKMAVLSIPFIPTLIIFISCNHILTYFNNMTFLNNYDYNRLAIWKFRYYNEFLVTAKKRLDKTKPTAEAILTNMYLENWKSSFSRGLSFLFSVFSVVLIIFSFAGFERFFNVDIIPLIAGSIFLSTILFTKKSYQEANMTTLRALIKKDLTKYELSQYFESKISILIKEVLSILYLPLMLYFGLSDRSYFIANFINTYVKDNICTWSAWSNQNASAKTKTSFYATSMDLSGSDLIVAI